MTKPSKLKTIRSYDWEAGRRNGIKWAITWLHAEARRMNDPHARQVLNNAAFGMGVVAKTLQRKRKAKTETTSPASAGSAPKSNPKQWAENLPIGRPSEVAGTRSLSDTGRRHSDDTANAVDSQRSNDGDPNAQ
ncbi:MAG: hypothetical protein WBA44_14820 [Mesorhizobium sp.]